MTATRDPVFRDLQQLGLTPAHARSLSRGIRRIRALDDRLYDYDDCDVDRAALAHFFTTALVPLGFSGVAAGSSRAVFFHPSGWCVKRALIEDFGEVMEGELAFLAEMPAALRPHFPRTLPLNWLTVLQETVPPDRAQYDAAWPALDAMAMRYGIPDVDARNVGFRPDGTFVFIDFATVDERPELPDEEPALGHAA